METCSAGLYRLGHVLIFKLELIGGCMRISLSGLIFYVTLLIATTTFLFVSKEALAEDNEFVWVQVSSHSDASNAVSVAKITCSSDLNAAANPQPSSTH